MLKFTFSLAFILLFTVIRSGFAADYQVYKASTAPAIDGIGSDVCWQAAAWAPMDQLWLGAAVSPTDFSGKYKIVWTSSKLYLLVEVTDNVLSDVYADPLSHWWDDDCVEVFLDEDASGGNHQYNYNAFAYHVSTTNDVVDLGTDQKPHLYNDHITTKRTKSGNVYTWEMAINLYTKDFVYGDASNTIATLSDKKQIGFSLAYCDNDGGASRESFIGSKTLAPADKDRSYIDASIFGRIELVDPGVTGVSNIEIVEGFNLYPNPVKEKLYFDRGANVTAPLVMTNSAGQVVFDSVKNYFNGSFIDVSSFSPGLYFVQLKSGSKVVHRKVVVY